MKNIYKLELMVAIAGIFILTIFIFQKSPTMTGYVSAVNTTIYVQNLDLIIDGTQSYALVSTSDNDTLHLKSFMIFGEVIGDGRVEILLDNGKGEEYLVYQNVHKKPNLSSRSPITGMAVNEDDAGNGPIHTKVGTWLVIQPKNPITYEFLPLAEDEEVVQGYFYNNCEETCDIPKNAFNSYSYNLIFRVEKGTSLKLERIEYVLHEENP